MATRPPVDRSSSQVFSGSGAGAGGGLAICAAAAAAKNMAMSNDKSALKRMVYFPEDGPAAPAGDFARGRAPDQVPLRPSSATRAATSAATAGVTNLTMSPP